MSLREFMHPRNVYKEKPNFKELALAYPEFKKHIIVDLTGKVKIDFKNEEALNTLARTLLKHDFNLQVEIPDKKLIPALPLRLNYILWIEDLMRHLLLKDKVDDLTKIHGIDIGTGAIAIYPLLISRLLKCKMLATEVDETSVNCANDNVKRNGMENSIKIVRVDKDTILKEALDDSTVYDFVMCNPPFFDADEIDNSPRKMKKEPPRNAPTGSANELEIAGGEIAFVTKILEDSLELKGRVKIYTTMLGRRKSSFRFKEKLRQANVENFTWTEFCQGFTKRWGVAWTFLPKDAIDLTQAPVIRMKSQSFAKTMKERPPLEILIAKDDKFKDIDEIAEDIEKLRSELEVELDELDLSEDEFEDIHKVFKLQAHSNTWSHARRKRREQMRKDSGEIPSKEDVKNKRPLSHEPYLICNLVLDKIHVESVKDDCYRLQMMFEDGNREALETLRQYLINRFNVRMLMQKLSVKHSQKSITKRRKKCKKDK